MEGFLNFRMRPWLRRLMTRSLAIAPAAFTIWYAGDKATYQLLILSQVILSMQLPFAVIPLIHFTSDRERMGAFANKAWVRVLAWVTAAIIIALNVRLAGMAIADWLAAAGAWKTAVWIAVVPISGGFAAAAVVGYDGAADEPVDAQVRPGAGGTARRPRAREIAAPVYHRILVPLDHTALDRLAVSHAAAMGKLYGARIYLLHVEEGRHQPGVRPGVIHGGSGAGRGSIWNGLRNPCGIRGLAWKQRSRIRPRRRRRFCVMPRKSTPTW